MTYYVNVLGTGANVVGPCIVEYDAKKREFATYYKNGLTETILNIKVGAVIQFIPRENGDDNSGFYTRVVDGYSYGLSTNGINVIDANNKDFSWYDSMVNRTTKKFGFIENVFSNLKDRFKDDATEENELIEALNI